MIRGVYTFQVVCDGCRRARVFQVVSDGMPNPNGIWGRPGLPGGWTERTVGGHLSTRLEQLCDACSPAPERRAVCNALRFERGETHACALAEGHAGEHRFDEHDCADCGSQHGTCRHCGTTHGDSHMSGCRWSKR